MKDTTTRVTYQYKIIIENFKNEKITVNLHESLPVSRNSELKVKLEKTNPEHMLMNEKGVIIWELALEPKAKKEVLFDFSVEYPKDKIVTGL